MPNKTNILLALVLLTAACPTVEDEPSITTPDPIGDELLRFTGTWSTCSGGAHLYREGREIQTQCFDSNDDFVYENRATLTADAAADLDAQIAAADPTNTTPINYMGFCGAPDSIGTVTLWIEDQSLVFDQSCLIEGIVPLYATIESIWTELSECGEGFPDRLASIEPGCRSY